MLLSYRDLDGALWQSYFRSHASFYTRCNICMDSFRQVQAQKKAQALQNSRPVGAVRAVDISSDEEEEEKVYDPVVVSRTSVEGRAILKWLNAARQRLGGEFPRPEARAQMEEYTRRMKERKLQLSQKGSRPDRGGKKKGAEEDEQQVFSRVHFSPASTAIMKMWVNKARDAIIARAAQKSNKIRARLAELLKDVKEEDDWFFTSEVRLEGESLAKTGRELAEIKEKLDVEATLKVQELEHEFQSFEKSHKEEMDTLELALENEIKLRRDAALKEAEAKVLELKQTMATKTNQFAQAEKTMSATERNKRLEEHKEELAALQDRIDNAETVSLQKVETSVAGLRQETRTKMDVHRRQVDAKRRTLSSESYAIRRAVFEKLKPREVSWHQKAVPWIERTARRVEEKTEEDNRQRTQAKERHRAKRRRA